MSYSDTFHAVPNWYWDDDSCPCDEGHEEECGVHGMDWVGETEEDARLIYERDVIE
jgi:hypothetical protein